MAKHIGFRNHSGTVDHICASDAEKAAFVAVDTCLLYTSPSPRDRTRSRMPSSA